MVEEFKSIKELILKSVFTAVGGEADDKNPRGSIAIIRELVTALASLAGKGKDEIIQLISREIGQAVAAAFEEPIRKALKDKKIKLVIELVPRHEHSGHKSPESAGHKKKRRN